MSPFLHTVCFAVSLLVSVQLEAAYGNLQKRGPAFPVVVSKVQGGIMYDNNLQQVLGVLCRKSNCFSGAGIPGVVDGGGSKEMVCGEKDFIDIAHRNYMDMLFGW